ncbi:MAG TPA: exodeoxyribonuclease V subunit alpha [Polyangiaceae bacterium]|nr:exodeoxyribonuclease V subunit alpha [Polyangiaceae bacterium]
MTAILDALRDARVFSALDAGLARHLGRLAGETRGDVLLAVALASRATKEGHTCADLKKLAGRPLEVDGDGTAFVCPRFESWREQVAASELVGTGAGSTPLVLDEKGRLYLRRHWEHERRLARALLERSARPVELADPEGARRLLARLFGEAKPGAPDWQRIAAQVAAISSLTVISGGPGTGKTSTVTKVLALAIADELARGNPNPRALLVAPTGKAASRLAESARRAVAALELPENVRARLPLQAATVHRVLEADDEGRFRITAERPLVADVVAVDEASMIDVGLMRALVDAVPDRARLILLGDRDQLASVEAGAVLADVCGDAGPPRYGKALAARLAAAFGEPLPAENTEGGASSIDDAVVTLTESHRFSAQSTLGELSRAIQRGDADAVMAIFERANDEVALLEPPSDRAAHPALPTILVRGFRELAQARTAREALAALERFRVLSAHRRGPLGVEEMNREILSLLSAAGLLTPRSGLVQPIIVNRNDAAVGLFNGDVGVLFREAEGSARALFPGEEDRLRRLSPSRLPPHEPAFAMSIHKSQGSEMDEVVVMLPAPGSPLLTRELFYTAVTRARRRVLVHASAASVREATARPAERASGLGDALRAKSGFEFRPLR